MLISHHFDYIFRHKLHYFSDYFNFLDIGAVLFPLLIIPFRATNLSVQWVFASLGYLCQALRGFKYAAVFRYINLNCYHVHFVFFTSFRSTGAYVQILSKIFIHDMIPFGAIFSLFLFSFTGAFYFALRGEEFTTTVVTSSNCSSEIDDENCVQNVTTTESSSLNIFPHLTM